MPPVVAVIPIIASVAVAVLKVSAVVKALIVVAAMVATTLLTKKPKSSANRIQQGAELATKISPSLPRTICIGHTAIGASCHFAFTYTDNSEKPNRYLVRVLQISDQPINSLLAVYDGKQALTFAGDVTTGWFACNQHKNKDGVACMWMRVYKGAISGAVADASVISWSSGAWSSAHKGTGISYAIVKYDYDGDAFPNGEPELVFAVQGAKVYDDRADSTVSGGSGSQRLATPSTWAYTDNVAVNIAQYLRGFPINGKRIMGVGADARDLSSQMLFSAYNTCDQSVSETGGTYKRYACGMNLASDETHESHLNDLMLAMDGKIFDRGGAITIWPGAIRTPVMNVGMQDIDWSAEKSWQPKPSLDALVNYVNGNFVDKDKFFQERDLPPRVNATWETDDGGQRFGTFVSLRAVNRWSQAQRITHRVHQASRFGGTVAIIGGIWLMEMEQGDWFTLTVPRWSMSSKLFEIVEITLTTDMRVAIVAQEVSNNFDSWDPASNEFDRTDDVWNGPSYDLPVPTFALETYSFIHPASGVQDFGINFQLLTPTQVTGSFVTSVQIQYAVTSNLAKAFNGGSVTLDETFRTIKGLAPATSYSVRARTTDGQRFSAWSSWQALSTDDPNTELVSALANIIDDSILTAVEKSHQLQDIYNDLEARYAPVFTRATTLGISTTALTNARNDWLALLAGYSPAWNDFQNDTDIYTSFFPDEDFPANPDASQPLTTGNLMSSLDITTWAGGAGVVAAGDGYYTITDDDAGSQENRNLTTNGVLSIGNAHHFVFRVKKTNSDRTVFFPNITGSDFTDNAGFMLDTKLGRAEVGAYVTDSLVVDEGDHWLCYVQFTPAGANFNLLILPAAGNVQVPLYSASDAMPTWQPIPAVQASITIKVVGLFAGVIPSTIHTERWESGSKPMLDFIPPYYRVMDRDATQWSVYGREKIQPAAATKYSLGLRVKKDAVGRATRYPIIRLAGAGGTAKTCDLAFDTATGEFANIQNAFDAFGVYDLGTEWFAWCTMTTNANNIAVQVAVYPAVGNGASMNVGTYTPGATGYIDMREPLLALGDIWQLGPAALIGREIAYAAAITAVQKAISEKDANTGIVIDPFPDVYIYASSTGVVKAGELPRDVQIKASQGGVDVTTLGTWSRSTTGGITCTMGAATGILNITAFTSKEANIPITFTYLGVTRTAKVHVVRVDDAAEVSGGGGGGGGGGSSGTSGSTTTLANTNGTSYGTGVSGTIKAVAGPAGQVVCVAPIDFKRVNSIASVGVTGCFGKWQWRITGGSFADITGGEQADTTPAETVGGAEPYKESGFVSCTRTKTGLTQGTEYEFRFLWRRDDDSGASSEIYRTAGTMTATGS